MASWADMEATMRRGRSPKLKLRLTVLCAVVMVSALGAATLSSDLELNTGLNHFTVCLSFRPIARSGARHEHAQRRPRLH